MKIMIIKQTPEFKEWLIKLKDIKAKAIIASRISRLEDGLMGDVEPIGSGLSELRIHYGPGYRVYIKQHGNKLIIVLSGGVKKTQKKDINRAKIIAENWSDKDE